MKKQVNTHKIVIVLSCMAALAFMGILVLKNIGTERPAKLDKTQWKEYRGQTFSFDFPPEFFPSGNSGFYTPKHDGSEITLVNTVNPSQIINIRVYHADDAKILSLLQPPYLCNKNDAVTWITVVDIKDCWPKDDMEAQESIMVAGVNSHLVVSPGPTDFFWGAEPIIKAFILEKDGRLYFIALSNMGERNNLSSLEKDILGTLSIDGSLGTTTINSSSISITTPKENESIYGFKPFDIEWTIPDEAIPIVRTITIYTYSDKAAINKEVGKRNWLANVPADAGHYSVYYYPGCTTEQNLSIILESDYGGYSGSRMVKLHGGGCGNEGY